MGLYYCTSATLRAHTANNLCMIVPFAASAVCAGGSAHAPLSRYPIEIGILAIKQSPHK